MKQTFRYATVVKHLCEMLKENYGLQIKKAVKIYIFNVLYR